MIEVAGNLINQISKKSVQKLEVKGTINGKETTFILDSGAGISVVAKELIEGCEIDQDKALNLRNADGSTLHVLGSTEVTLEVKKGEIMREAVQVLEKLPGKVLIGLPTILKFGLNKFLPDEVITRMVQGSEKIEILEESTGNSGKVEEKAGIPEEITGGRSKLEKVETEPIESIFGEADKIWGNSKKEVYLNLVKEEFGINLQLDSDEKFEIFKCTSKAKEKEQFFNAFANFEFGEEKVSDFEAYDVLDIENSPSEEAKKVEN